MGIEIKNFPSGPLATNAIVVTVASKEAVIIDPAPGAHKPIMEWVQKGKLTVQAIWLTHTHWDHIADCAGLKAHYKVPVSVHPLDVGNLETPGSDGLPVFLETPITGVQADVFFEDGQIVSIGDVAFEVLHTPGHCPGLVCFYAAEEGVLISGDLLFCGGIGSLMLPTAEPEKMRESLRRIAQLPPDTVVYPGHGETTTVGNELGDREWLY